MNSQTHQSVAAAVAAVHAPDTPAAVRAQAGAFLEAFKARPDCAQTSLELFFSCSPTAASVAVQGKQAAALVQGDDTTPLRHFALHALESAFRQHWYAWDRATVGRIKSAVVEIAATRLGDILAEPLAIREKVVTLLVDAAKRDWPQRWPTFLDQIVLNQLCRAGFTQADAGVRILRRLAEDGTSPDFNTELPVKRRHEILSALHSSAPQFLPTLLQLLTAQYGAWVQSQRTNKRAILLTGTVLDTLALLCDWLPLEVIYNPPSPAADMRQIFATLMQEPHVATRCLAARCLTRCIARHKVMTPTIEPYVLPMLNVVTGVCMRQLGMSAPAPAGGGRGAGGVPTSILPSVITEDVLTRAAAVDATAAAAAAINENEYDFYKLLATLIGVTGVNLIAKMDDPCGTGPSGDNGAMLRNFLDVALVLLAHPSIEISTEVLSAWSQLFERTPAVLSSPHALPLRGALLHILTIKLRKWGSPDDSDRSGLVSAFSVFDYDDHEAFLVAYGKIRGRVTSLIRCLSRADPNVALQHLGRTVHALLTGPHATPRDMLRPSTTTLATMWSTCFVLSESIATLTDVIVCSVGSYNEVSSGDGNAPRAANESEALLKPMHDIAHLWFQFAPTDPLLLCQQIVALTAFGSAGYYRRDTALLGSVLEKLFVSVTHIPPEEAAALAAMSASAGGGSGSNTTFGATVSSSSSSAAGDQAEGTASAVGDRKPRLQSLHGDTRSSRRRAASSLIRLGASMPKLMFSHLQGLCGRTNSLMSRGQLLPNEASLLFEMLVLVSNSFNDLNKQRAFLDDVLTNSLSFWTSPGTAAAVSSAKAYAAAVQGSDRQSRWQVQTTLTTFTCVAKRSRALPCGAGGTGVAVPQQHAGQLGAAAWSLQHPFVHKWAAILPNLFSLIRSLHALWRPEFRSPIEQAADIRWMVRISPLELMSIVGYEDHFESNSSSSGGSVGNSSSGGPSNYSSSSMHSPQSSRASASALNSANAARESDVELATQMTHARLRAYDLVALAAVHGASVQRDSQNYQRIQAVESAVTVAYRENPTSYTPGRGGLFDIPNVLGMIRQSLLSDLDSMEHRHFRSLLTAFFEPYCLSCPLPLFASHVRPVFIQLFEHAHKRVSDAWAGWNTGTGDATAARGGGGVRVGVGSAPEKKRVVNRCHMPLGVPAGSTELIYAKIIRDVGREVISTLAELIPARPPRRDPVTGRIVKQRPGNKRRTARQTPFYVSPLASLLLGDTGWRATCKRGGWVRANRAANTFHGRILARLGDTGESYPCGRADIARCDRQCRVLSVGRWVSALGVRAVTLFRIAELQGEPARADQCDFDHLLWRLPRPHPGRAGRRRRSTRRIRWLAGGPKRRGQSGRSRWPGCRRRREQCGVPRFCVAARRVAACDDDAEYVSEQGEEHEKQASRRARIFADGRADGERPRLGRGGGFAQPGQPFGKEGVESAKLARACGGPRKAGTSRGQGV